MTKRRREKTTGERMREEAGWGPGKDKQQAGGDNQTGPQKPRLATTRLDGIRPLPIRFLVPDLIPLGKLVLFAGDGGNGKTALTLDITANVTRGRPCFGLQYDAPPPAEVLLISCEDDFGDTVVPRLLAAGADLTKVFRVDGIRGEDGQILPFNMAYFEALGGSWRRGPTSAPS